MATAEELLATLSPDEAVLVIDNNLRTVAIPDSVKILGVENDKDVRRLNFQMPRTCDKCDLSEFAIRINYRNAGGMCDVYRVKDAVIGEDSITFSWLVGKTAAAYKGQVSFIVCAKLFEDGQLVKEFHSQIAQLPVLEGLEASEAVVQENPDIIEDILKRLDDLEHTGGVSDEQIGNAVNAYLTEHPVTPGATEEQAAQIQKNKEDIETLKQTGAGQPGEDGEDGKDGVSPTISVSNITGGHRVTVTDVNGTQTFDVMDGQDGKDGTSGSGGSSVELDTTLKEAGKAADAKATGDALDELKEAIDALGGSGGLSQNEKNNLLTIFETVAIAHYSEDVTTAFNALKTAWGNAVPVPATSITLNPTSLSFDSATSKRITATLEPSNATDKVVWSSDDENVAYVENGTVYAVANGTATITATAGSVSATCSVAVNIAATMYSVTYNLANATSSTNVSTVTEGEPFTATITANDGYKLASVTYTMAGGSAVNVSDGVINIASVLGDIIINATAVSEGSEDDPTAWISGTPYVFDVIASSYYDKNNGNALAYDGWERTPLLPCYGAKYLRFDIDSSIYNTDYNLFFGEDKTGIGGSTFYMGAGMQDVTVPDGAYFVAMSNKAGTFEHVTVTPFGE